VAAEATAYGRRDAYGANYARLVALKTQFDPGNLFRMNLNIPPISTAASV
jgi:FAD/FMN-containing dehydrogenase